MVVEEFDLKAHEDFELDLEAWGRMGRILRHSLVGSRHHHEVLEGRYAQ